jgi:molybdenum cofactor cytidylyltransferase
MTDVSPRLRGLVLAAGASRRLGRPKQIVHVGGVPLVRRTVLLIAEICGSPVTVVTGANASQVTASLHGLDVVPAHNAGWREGLASSLAVGLESLEPDWNAALVAPCDLPGLAAGDLERLAHAWRRTPERAAAAAYSGIIGTPAILPRQILPRLATVRGDRGARDLLRRNDLPVTVVDFPSARQDLDHDEDLAAMPESRAVSLPR